MVDSGKRVRLGREEGEGKGEGKSDLKCYRKKFLISLSACHIVLSFLSSGTWGMIS